MIEMGVIVKIWRNIDGSKEKSENIYFIVYCNLHMIKYILLLISPSGVWLSPFVLLKEHLRSFSNLHDSLAS